jgi:hypothetical protein
MIIAIAIAAFGVGVLIGWVFGVRHCSQKKPAHR